MNRKRLHILAKFLKNVDRTHFDLGTWCTIDGGQIKDGRIAKVGCGTTACAMGWAANVPSFNRDGLRLIRTGCRFFPIQPKFKRKTGIDAAVAFFDIDNDSACHLFDPFEYPESQRKSAGAVVRRIEALLKK